MEAYEIGGHQVNPGENQKIELDIADLASGTKIFLPIYVFNGKIPGKRVMLTGGLHGDEINGVEIVRHIISNSDIQNLQQGTLVAIPLLNIYGFINFSRDVVDGKDMNRSFPGSKSGSLASRIAYIISSKVLPNIDVGIDFHTGGGARYNYPQTRYSKDHQGSKALADIFGAPIALSASIIPKSFRSEAIKGDKSVIVYEGGEAQRLNQESVEEGINGVIRVLRHYDMIQGKGEKKVSEHFVRSKWVRAEDAGLFKSNVKSGEYVEKDQILGIIHQIDPKKKSLSVKSSVTGRVIGHNNSPVVNQGDALFHVASK